MLGRPWFDETKSLRTNVDSPGKDKMSGVWIKSLKVVILGILLLTSIYLAVFCNVKHTHTQ